MTIVPLHGTCLCKAVSFEVQFDTDRGSSRCNCSSCWKLRIWGYLTKPSEVKISGKENLTSYIHNPNGLKLDYPFCKTCGVHLYHYGKMPDNTEFINVNMACVDERPEELLSAKVGLADGLNNKWYIEPADKRHL
ncbi:centromere protein V [Acrasis kona]|uniref:Centromere protein V n=1 Tax=Acrasis kona TaxID=1008807 RepID=A0AAW2YR88_9EUKA